MVDIKRLIAIRKLSVSRWIHGEDGELQGSPHCGQHQVDLAQRSDGSCAASLLTPKKDGGQENVDCQD
jgi:hypothetical protein